MSCCVCCVCHDCVAFDWCATFWGLSQHILHLCMYCIYIIGWFQGSYWPHTCHHLSYSSHVLWNNKVSQTDGLKDHLCACCTMWMVCLSAFVCIIAPRVGIATQFWFLILCISTVAATPHDCALPLSLLVCPSSGQWLLFWSCWQPCVWWKEAMRRSWLALTTSKW